MNRCAMLIVVLVGLTLTVAGCQDRQSNQAHAQAPASVTPPQAASAAGGTVVVDVLAVARAMGRDEAFRQQMQVVNQRLNEELQRIQKELQDQINAKQEEFGDEPTEEQTRQLQQLAVAANQRFAQARAVAQQRQAQISAALGNQFRDEIKPIAESIAKERSASMAIMNTDNLLWYAPEADITGKVIEMLRAKPAQDPEAENAQAPENQ